MLDLALKNNRITLVDLDLFYNILRLNLKRTRTILLDSDYLMNQAGTTLDSPFRY